MPRKTLLQKSQDKQRKGNKIVSETNDLNRIRPILDGIIGNEDPDDLMLEILSVLREGGKSVIPGRYYTFVYIPKTPLIQYDQNPLVAVTDLFNWGFRGINLHWGAPRQYTWDEIPGGVYEIRPEEVDDAKSIPYANIRLNT
jgi:hypothetical protein